MFTSVQDSGDFLRWSTARARSEQFSNENKVHASKKRCRPEHKLGFSLFPSEIFYLYRLLRVVSFDRCEVGMLARKRVAELMDDPSLDADVHQEALGGLEKLNIISTSADALWQQLRTIRLVEPTQPLRILDLACGGGDIAIALVKKAAQERPSRLINIDALDISDTAVEYATKKARDEQLNSSLRFIQLDVLNDALPENYDAVICSLFTHHLDPPEVVSLMRKMRGSAKKMVIVNDLLRNELSYALVWLGTRIFSRSAVVHYDGPVSVCASYTMDEMRSMAKEAGLQNSFVKFHPPCRQLLIWKIDETESSI